MEEEICGDELKDEDDTITDERKSMGKVSLKLSLYITCLSKKIEKSVTAKKKKERSDMKYIYIYIQRLKF